MGNDTLITTAEAVLNRHKESGRLFGDVGAALETTSGNVYTGICLDTPSWGLCAERSAIAAMVTAGEYTIRKIVAVWKDEKKGKLYVLPPCGICREFVKNVSNSNLEAEVILTRNKTVKLKELLPYHEWPTPLE